jgi:beta-lactamase class A
MRAVQTVVLAVAVGLALTACLPARNLAEATVAPATAVEGKAAAIAQRNPREAQLATVVTDVETDAPDTYGIVIEDLTSGARRAFNEDRVFASGSVYKLPLAWEVLRQVDAGRFALDTPLPIEPDDAVEVEPFGGFGPGDAPTIREAIGGMLSVSSNSAAHALLRVIGRQNFNASLDRLGLTHTRVPEVVDELDASEAVTSASDMARVLRMLAMGDGLSPGMLQELRAALAVGGWPDALRDALPDEVTVLDKTGNLDQASNVGALLVTPRSTVLLVVLDHGVDPGDARTVIAQLGRAAYDAYLRPDEQ